MSVCKCGSPDAIRMSSNNTKVCCECGTARPWKLKEGQKSILTERVGEKEMSTIETDPNGTQAHERGAKLDEGKPRVGLVLNGFSRALIEVCKVGTEGAAKYSDNGWKYVPNGINRYTDSLGRHILYEAIGEEVDSDFGLLHAAHTAWNALARLELILLEKEEDLQAQHEIIQARRNDGV